jgi:hypothetical protein
MLEVATMSAIPKAADKRIREGIKKYKGILRTAKDRDVNESDTVTIVNDMLADICGYDKYGEITREYAIRGTFCDLAIKLEEKLVFLMEVKAIGIELKDSHLRQALQYASSANVEWVVLTNGDRWQAHRVMFEKPIKTEIAFDFSFIDPPKITRLIEYFFLLGKEGAKKSAIDAYHEERQLTSRFMIAQILQTDLVLDIVRKQLRKLSKQVRITNEDILNTLQLQILKREVTEGEDATHAKKKLASVSRKKTNQDKKDEESVGKESASSMN